jgi:hypothetical protein
VRRNRRDRQCIEESLELRRLPHARQLLLHRFRRIHPEGAVPVVIQSKRSAITLDDHAHEEKVAVHILLRAEEQRQQFPRRIVNRRE